MARDTGPTCKRARRYGQDLEHKTRDLASKCKLSTPPGQHGQRKRRETNYGLQLAAKQMLRHKYGVLEKYFRNLYKKSARLKGVTGTNLLQLLESRLDNVAFRMGFAATRREARQLVSHGALLVNGGKVDVPSYHVKAGDVITVREKSRGQERIKDALTAAEDRG